MQNGWVGIAVWGAECLSDLFFGGMPIRGVEILLYFNILCDNLIHRANIRGCIFLKKGKKSLFIEMGVNESELLPVWTPLSKASTLCCTTTFAIRTENLRAVLSSVLSMDPTVWLKCENK